MSSPPNVEAKESKVQGAAPNSRAGYWRERKRRLKDASRTPEQREALALAANLQSVADDYPSLKCEINEFLYLLNQRGHQSQDVVTERLMQALKFGGSLEDLCEETKFAEWAVTKALESMRTLGVAEEVPRGRVNNDGVQPTIWRLTGNPAKSSDVLP